MKSSFFINTRTMVNIFGQKIMMNPKLFIGSYNKKKSKFSLDFPFQTELLV